MLDRFLRKCAIKKTEKTEQSVDNRQFVGITSKALISVIVVFDASKLRITVLRYYVLAACLHSAKSPFPRKRDRTFAQPSTH